MTKAEKLLLICGLILLLSLIGLRALGDKPPDHWPIKAGESSAWDGQCMTPERSIELGLMASQCKDRIAVELERCQAKAANELELSRRRKAIDSERQQGQVEILRDRLEDATAWYRDPVFVATVTAVLTVAALLGARQLIVETQ